MKNYRLPMILLLIVGLLFWTKFSLIPQQQAAAEAYAIAKLSPFTNSMEDLTPYRNAHMGNQNNTSKLFKALPLAGVEKVFWYHTQYYSVHIDYMPKVAEVGATNMMQRLGETEFARLSVSKDFPLLCEQEVYTDLVYNSAVAFALLDDLQMMIYSFADQDFAIDRSVLSESTGWNWQQLFTTEAWIEMTDDLADQVFVDNIIDYAFLDICYCYTYDDHQRKADMHDDGETD